LRANGSIVEKKTRVFCRPDDQAESMTENVKVLVTSLVDFGWLGVYVYTILKNRGKVEDKQ